jgi:hypothetical protein
VSDWEQAAATDCIRACPQALLTDIKVGDYIAWYVLGGTFDGCYIGIVSRVQSRRAKLPITAVFADGTLYLAPRAAAYGASGGR